MQYNFRSPFLYHFTLIAIHLNSVETLQTARLYTTDLYHPFRKMVLTLFPTIVYFDSFYL